MSTGLERLVSAALLLWLPLLLPLQCTRISVSIEGAMLDADAATVTEPRVSSSSSHTNFTTSGRRGPSGGLGSESTSKTDILFYNKISSLPLDARIVVVGAGPSGLHMAFMLKKKGYRNITILEKTDRVGGKSYTLYFKADGTPCNQRPLKPDGRTDWEKPIDRECRPMEQGTCFLHSGYHFVRNLVLELGLHGEKPPANGPSTAVTAHDTQCVISKKVFEGSTTAEGIPKAERFDLWGARLMEQENPGVSQNELSSRLSKEVFQYIKLHVEIFRYEDPAYTFPSRPSKEHLDELSIPFETWLKKNGLTTLPAILSLAQAAQGYGYLNDVPTYYGMLWITPTFFCGLMQYTMFQMLGLAKNRNGETIFTRVLNDAMTSIFHAAVGRGKCKVSQQVMEGATMLPEGYAAIWKNIYEKHFLDKVDFLVDDLVIHRKMSERHPVKVSYTVPSSQGAKKVSQSFDFLIYSGPARAAHKYIKDSTMFERMIFSEHWTGANLVAYTYKSPPVPSYSDEAANYALLYFPDRLHGKESDGKWYQDNSGHIFAAKPDFSNHQLRRSLQYYSRELGDVDQQMPAAQMVQASYQSPHGQERRDKLRIAYRNLGHNTSSTREKIFADLRESMAAYIPKSKGGIDAVDFMDGNYSFPFPYFSRYNADGLKLGRPWDLEEAQGDDHKMPRTWYVGGSMVFESVNDIIGYNLRMLRRHSKWSQTFQPKKAAYGHLGANQACHNWAAQGYFPASACLEDPQPPLI